MMSVSRPVWIVGAVCCCAFAGSALAWRQARPPLRIKRLYVEPFTTKAGSEKLREDVIAQLRKLSSISLVSGDSEADAILGGGGEIWIRGYRSLNPRSGTMPSNGTPVYGGSLSVELRNTKGETLWSYLVTPGAESDDVSKELAKRIAKHLPDGLQQSDGPARTAPVPQATKVLKGAGATFPYPALP